MSPRPKKDRRCLCCHRDGFVEVYKPAGIPLSELQQVPVGQDELEVLSLCDVQGLTQQEAGDSMGVSRGTVQRLLAGARRKVADALLEGKALVVK